MSNLVEIKKRIASISSTIKVTKVMQMIATAKIAKIKQMMASAVKYSDVADRVISSYVRYSQYQYEMQRFFQKNGACKVSSILIILISSDKGMCGGINANVFKEFKQVCQKNLNDNVKVAVCAVGKKARIFLEGYRKTHEIEVFSDIFPDAESCDSMVVDRILHTCVEMFAQSKIDKVYFLYHKFKNIITSNVVCEQMLPIDAAGIKVEDDGFVNIEESEETPVGMVEFFIRNRFYSAYISNLLSIVSSRMNAMDNATKNGQAIIDELRIKYNKGRQASITSELSDIVSGFESIS